MNSKTNKKKKVVLTWKQSQIIKQKLQIAKFERLTQGLVKEKGLSTDEKAKLIYQLRKKLFPNSKIRF
jgi:lipoprotein NlpI